MKRRAGHSLIPRLSGLCFPPPHLISFAREPRNKAIAGHDKGCSDDEE